MRKKTITKVADTTFWYLLYFLPVVIYLLYILALPSSSTTIVNFSDLLNSVGIGFVANNIITESLVGIFGVGGVMPLFSTNIAFEILTWFISMVIIHLAVDFILFIPRLAHKWLGDITKGD